MARFLFWAVAALISYTYAGFPALVLLRARLRPRPHASEPIRPTVSIVIAAFQEEADIGAKVANLLALDYPRESLELLVASDGSTDGTVAAARAAAAGDERVRVLDLPRTGKAGALNTAVAQATGEILVFSDANSMFAPTAVQELVAPFADPEVGGVAGDQRYLPDGDGADAGVAKGERGYWDLDRIIKEAESAGGNVISATGAIYAIRRSLFAQVPDGVTDDFATSTAVIAAGHRLVFAPRALAFEPVGATTGVEFGRKVRVMTRGLNGVVLRRELLNPRRHGFYAVQLFSHKVLRRLMALPLIVLALTSLRLATRSPFYALAALGQWSIYLLGGAALASGGRGPFRHRLFAIPGFFLMVNYASLKAASNVLRGRRVDRWQPARES